MSGGERLRRPRSCAAGPGPGRRGGACARTMFDLSPKSTIPISGPPSSGSPDVRDRRRRDLADEVLVLPARHGPRGRARPRRGPISPGAVTMPRRQPFARRWRASARVSTPAIAGMPLSRRSAASWRASSSDRGRRVGDDQRPQPRPDRLVVVGEPAVVADQRVGHDDDLAGVRGVGADLLVAGLAGVDDEVAAGRDRRPERDAREDRAVLERQQRRTEVADPRDRRPRSAGAPAARVGRSRGPGYDEPTGLGGSVGGRVRGHRCLLRRPHGTGTPASQDRP